MKGVRASRPHSLREPPRVGRPRSWIGAAVMAIGLLSSGMTWAAAYRPTEDAEVLERLPVPGPEHRELRSLRSAVQSQPNRADLALNLARRYIEQGRGDSDPRYYGYAEAVLRPWLAAANPLPEALVLRATVRQNRHAFTAALADLDAALRLNPRLGQAWLTRAAILEVLGDYLSALASCRGVARWASPLAAAACLHSALSLAGRVESSYRDLSATVAQVDADPAELLWVRVILAEMAERRGHPAEAERWYRAGLGEGIRSIYLLSTYADFLLDQNRPAEAVRLLEGETRADPLLLRLALAEQRLIHPKFREHAAMLGLRFAASRARGDTAHQGDESRYTLHITMNPAAALQLALANWSVQREPRDARILLEAALAAGDSEPVRIVIDFLERTGLEDARLQKLLKNKALPIGSGPRSGMNPGLREWEAQLAHHLL